ncbi:MAG: HAD family hydrolase [Candidatus Eiseniibacteriota bacterium]
MPTEPTRLRGVIFDYGNTLIWLGPKRLSSRTDYADVVAKPGAERMAALLHREGALENGDASRAFQERFLAIREEDRTRAEKTGAEAAAVDSLAKTASSLGMPAFSPDLLRRAVAENFAPEIEAIEPLPGAGDTLEFLRGRGVKVALLSNCTDGPYVDTVIRRLGWRDYFDPFVVSSDVGYRKPLPEVFRPVLERWTMPPREMVMVGDSLYHDVGGAERLGLNAVHFTAIANPGDPEHRATIRPQWAAATHRELREVLTPHLG